MLSGVGANTRSLIDLAPEVSAVVIGVDVQRVGSGTARRLAEIGFLPGESIRVLARMPGGDPIAVRIGSSTFALRRHEASCILVQTQPVPA
jgi:ferrous iron transport protein A